MIEKIRGKVQHYAWGGSQFIPQLLHIPADDKPYAEYWLGAHPSAPSTLSNHQTLPDWIKQNPAEILGSGVYKQFKELPYLFKVLDVKEMLSIQVHPTKEEAIKGFEAEEAAGIAINAPHRNYKDKNHKPEVMIALSSFWLLHGFKTASAIEELLTVIAPFNVLLALFKKEGYKGLYEFIMQMPQEQVDTILMPVIKQELIKQKEGSLTKNQPGYWVTQLYPNQQDVKNIDRGIFSIYLFNIVELQKGEAIFQAAGVPHAYLQGQNIELMANSDNVLRGGLTPKYIDVTELIKHTKFEATIPQIITGDVLGFEKNYPCPVDDFALSAIELKAGETYTALSTSLEIILVAEGAVLLPQQTSFVAKQGEAMAIAANTHYSITATGNTVLYKAFNRL